MRHDHTWPRASTLRRYACLALIALGLALMASGLGAGGTGAHDPEILVNTQPPDGTTLQESPAQVMAWFNTELDTRLSSLQVLDINNQPVDNGDGRVEINNPGYATMIVSLPPLPDGAYIVQWTVVTAIDGDLVSGVFTFGVSEAEGVSDQASPADSPPAETGGLRPVYLILAAGLAALALVAIGVVFYTRFVRG